MKKLLHWWRLLTEPSGKGRLTVCQPKRWVVHYKDGNFTVPMAYDIACDYTEMWDGEVKRYEKADEQTLLSYPIRTTVIKEKTCK